MLRISPFSFSTAGLATAALLLAVGVTPVQAAPQPTNSVTCQGGSLCTVEVDTPGSPTAPSSSEDHGKSKSGGSKKASASKKSGKDTCSSDGRDVPCKDKEFGSWSQSDQCYWALQKPQDPPPAGKTADEGAWYVCTGAAPEENDVGMVTDRLSRAPVWRATPPKGVTKLSPGQAAARLVKQMHFKPVAIGTSTDVYDSNRWYVGMPLWLWVKNKTDVQVMGPYSKSATIGGTTVTAKAELSSITYTMGDGGKVVCGNGGGTVFQKSRIHQFSPSKCDYEYSKMSAKNGKGTYTITATSSWNVNWSADGQTGTIPAQVQSTKTIRVGEIQTLNVK